VIELILFLAVGALLLFFVFLQLRRTPQAEGSAQALRDARRALDSLQGTLLPADIVARILSMEDLEYVTSTAPENVRKMFLAERKKVALSWVGHIRLQVVSLRQFHLRSARLYARLKFGTEMALAFDFANLLLACRVLEIALYLRGPYGAGRMVRATTLAAAKICEISEKSLEFLRPESANAINNSARQDGVLP
jgi:hypothetical protein